MEVNTMIYLFQRSNYTCMPNVKLHVFPFWAAHFCININWAKTKIQTTDVTVPPGSTVQVGGSNMEVVDTFTYLGCQLHSSGGSEHEVNRRISISHNCMQMLDRHIWRFIISVSTKLRLYNVYTPGIFIWSRNLVHNQSYREEN